MRVATVEYGNVDQAQAAVRDATAVLAEGGLVVFPTETVYGVAACATSDSGFQRLCRLRGGHQASTFTVHLPDPISANRYIELVPAMRHFVLKALSGPVTLLIDVPDPAIDRCLAQCNLSPAVRSRIYAGHTVSLRCPKQPLTQEILAAVPGPVLAGAAHLPGEDLPRDAEHAAQQLDGLVDYIIDGGVTRYAQPSTVVRITNATRPLRVQVERPGVYDERLIQRMTQWTILLLCSGNTCRSPMAQGLATQLLALQHGVAEDDLESVGFRIESAGTMAADGQPPTSEAVEALSREGIDIAEHRSKFLTPEIIHQADVIYTMTGAQREAVVNMVPSARSKTLQLDESGDIADPFGLDVTAYQRTAEVIRRRLAQRLKEQDL